MTTHHDDEPIILTEARRARERGHLAVLVRITRDGEMAVSALNCSGPQAAFLLRGAVEMYPQHLDEAERAQLRAMLDEAAALDEARGPIRNPGGN